MLKLRQGLQQQKSFGVENFDADLEVLTFGGPLKKVMAI